MLPRCCCGGGEGLQCCSCLLTPAAGPRARSPPSRPPPLNLPSAPGEPALKLPSAPGGPALKLLLALEVRWKVRTCSGSHTWGMGSSARAVTAERQYKLRDVVDFARAHLLATSQVPIWLLQ
jgi:hypothetical protein